jgi:hypothetical protein
VLLGRPKKPQQCEQKHTDNKGYMAIGAIFRTTSTLQTTKILTTFATKKIGLLES